MNKRLRPATDRSAAAAREIPAEGPDLILGVTPFGRPDSELVIACCRAGALGILDLGRDPDAARKALSRIRARNQTHFGIRVTSVGMLREELPELVSTIVFPAPLQFDSKDWPGRRVLVEVTSIEEARAAAAAGAYGLIAKGNESGGRIGSETTFVLLQRLCREFDSPAFKRGERRGGLPVWAQGGIGLHSIAACITGGACGVVLDAQLALVRESTLAPDVKSAIRAMDGSEAIVIGGHRVYTRPDLPVAQLAEDTSAAYVAERLGGDDLRTQLLPVGQDGAFARSLADRFKTAGGVVHALRTSLAAHLRTAQTLKPLAPGGGVATVNGTKYPIVQGPMTRVSDGAPFAAAVADAGGLPLLALALMTASEVRSLLRETVSLVGNRPWGVGILGFVPPEIRKAQLEVVQEFRPPVALIAGGRPSQAKPLEADGTKTYLHVPSPGLLTRFLKDGGRRFVFEGRECGGHVGPRSSFALWESQIEQLLAFDHPEELDVLFAGGIHDARSAAMVAAMAAPLAERGTRIGVLMGTAYLLTKEAVSCGAILREFQKVAVACDHTVLLETSPGHVTRAADSGYVRAFAEEKRRLMEEGVDAQAMWAALEQLNLGRLRIASKGLRREGDALVKVGVPAQREEGLYMIGQVAALCRDVVSVAELHEDVSAGGTHWLASIPAVEEPAGTAQPLDVAIIGMAGFFPGAAGADEFWANIVAGVDAITEVPAERWSADRYYDPDALIKGAGEKTPSRWGGFLPEIPFDPLRYGIPPRSLASIEPAQLLSLEVAARALADAGYADREFDREHTSVIFGAEAGTDLAGAYGFRALFPQYFGELPAALSAALPRLTEDSFPGVLTNVIAGRIANRLDLRGVNYTVDAACAASLAAVDLACKELTGGSSSMVLCGGADLHNGVHDYLMFSSVHALSPSGRCRTFDAEADGITLGEGVACLVLKRRADAERDGDRIYAVINAVAGSSDGRSLGLTAPRPEGQQLALERAYRQAGSSPAEVGLVEAHGTGTVVGDRTELTTLTQLFAAAGALPHSCVLGSVKSQIGHTKCAAGLAGMIKASRSLYHGVLPPTLHIRKPNQGYDAQTSPFTFTHSARPWPREKRRAGVSAFGFGGANFHVVLSSYDGGETPAHGLDKWPAEIFLFRGEDRATAHAAIARLLTAVEQAGPADVPWRLRDLARTVAAWGAREPVQVAVVADDIGDLQAKLRAASAPASSDGVFPRREIKGEVAFLFPGQGSQRLGMLADLYVAFPRLQRFLRLGHRWNDRMFPPAAFSPEERAAMSAALTDTRVAQPALGIAGLTMNELLRTLGVAPAMAGGHSYGELVALCTAGAFSEADLLALSEARGEAILAAAGTDPGSMAAVHGSAAAVAHALGKNFDVVIANDNSPEQCVISGPTLAIEQAVAALENGGLRAQRIPVACAFHSRLVGAARDTLAARLAGQEVASPAFPVWSNASAEPYPAPPDAVRETLAGQVAKPVRFTDEIEAMYNAGARIFVEAGPGRVLTGCVRKILGDRPHVAVACDVQGDHGIRRLLLALAELAACGVPVDTAPLFEGRDATVLNFDAPAARTGYRVNGHLVRTVDGAVVPGGLQPAPAGLALPVPVAARAPSGDREGAVHEYLRGLREIVAAEREVMLRYLGAPAEAISRPALAPAAERTAVLPDTPEPPASPSANGGGPREMLSGAALLKVVLAIVSERTGYPEDMLDADLDLEADLSIDSIKRMEIIGELADRVGMPGMAEGGIDEAVVEELARLKTLRAIVAWIDENITAENGTATPPAQVAPAPETRVASDRGAVPERTQRYLVRLEEIPTNDAPPMALAGLRVAISDDGRGIALALAEQLREHEAEVQVLSPEQPLGHVDALVDLAGLRTESPSSVGAFFDLIRSAVISETECIIAATGAGGSFGHDSRGPSAPEAAIRAGGARGLLKTVAREYPRLRVEAIDVDPAESEHRLAASILSELIHGDGRVEIGRTEGLRYGLRVAAQALDPAQVAEGFDLDAKSVVLITGGARGIGARTALALARERGCCIELVGRSPLPEAAEAPVFAGAADAVALRRALVTEGRLTDPAAIEAECARLLAAREIRQTMRALGETGVPVTYHAVDVRDAEAFARTVESIYARHGRLDGVIHAAGILEDKLIRDKSPESFRRVFATKAASAVTLAKVLRPDVRFVVCFGSIAGVFGNRGQVDYAAANAALGAIARYLDRRIAGRAVCIHWGPWAGTGMVSPALAREYARRGIGLIDPEDGVKCLMDELRFGSRNDVEVVLMRATPEQLTAIGHEAGDPHAAHRNDGRQDVLRAEPGHQVRPGFDE
jgi:acyl transferase domain-containing protein/NAD(P)H-dependent flavin oxidoreductase YrpB (nitropropane dioxygenase family)/NAD(P)-dependent dehydrogenase (short-subunit alcohol dehydrogenase family)